MDAAGQLVDPDTLLDAPWGLFHDWLLFAQLEPFGPRQEEMRAARVGQLIVNCSGRVKEPWQTWDVMPSLRPEPVETEEPSAEKQIAHFQAIWGDRLVIKPRGTK